MRWGVFLLSCNALLFVLRSSVSRTRVDQLSSEKAEVKKIGYFAKHEKSANHIAVMKAVEQEKAGAAMTRFVSVEPADALLVRTISSLAWSILNKLPSAIFGELMSIQHQNGVVVSLNHTSNESVLILLRCGGIVVRQMQLENLVPPFMRRIFRHGVPFSFIGDGSQDSSHTEVTANPCLKKSPRLLIFVFV